MMIPFLLACDSATPQISVRPSKGRKEVEELLNVFKCTPEELYEKCKNNKKLLSKSGNKFLNLLVEHRKKGGEE